MKKMNKKGFTIVELVIVIAVIAILAAVLIPTFSGVVDKANVSAAQQSARNALTAGLQMTSNASLPSGTSILVNTDKKGGPEYLFKYENNALAQASIVDSDNAYLTDCYTINGNKANYLCIELTKKAVGKTYVKETEDSDGNVTAIENIDATAYAAITDDATKKAYTEVATVDSTVIDEIKALFNPGSTLAVSTEYNAAGQLIVKTTDDITSGTVADNAEWTTQLTLTIYGSTDMPAGAFILVYLG